RISKDPEGAIQTQVHARRLDHRLVEGLDNQPPVEDLLQDAPVAENHAVPPITVGQLARTMRATRDRGWPFASRLQRVNQPKGTRCTWKPASCKCRTTSSRICKATVGSAGSPKRCAKGLTTRSRALSCRARV